VSRYCRKGIGKDSLSAEINGYIDESKYTKVSGEVKLANSRKSFIEMEDGNINGRIVLDLR